jgi:hypothetical protein
MPQTHELLKNYFWYPQRLTKEGPRIRRAPTHELDYPYRVSDSLVVRLYGSHGFVAGRWVSQDLDEEEASENALQAAVGGLVELPEAVETISDFYRPALSTEELREQASKARAAVAAHSQSIEDEWFLLQMTGLDQ